MKQTELQPLNWTAAFFYALAAIASFHLAYAAISCESLIAVFLFCLLRLAWLPTGRRAVYFGLAIGFAIYGPHLSFFWRIFGGGALALWFVLAFWLAVFLALARALRVRFGQNALFIAVPFLWTGIEYFRSELYYLRFTWLNVGYVFSESKQLPVAARFGVYGCGFMLVALAGLVCALPRKLKILPIIPIVVAVIWPTSASPALSKTSLQVAGVQMEFPQPDEVLPALEKTLRKFPKTDLFLLSEYTFDGPVPGAIKDWCRKNKKFLVAGGKDYLPDQTQFYDTAFVIDSNGELVFKQAKSVPVQFFKDGLPAQEQKVWDSPWGKIGLCICYDLSYAHVTDELIRRGAQALIVPTLDARDWGEHAHRLHTRVARMRAAEYHVPIFRVDGCGFSQLVHPGSWIEVTEPFPGDGAMIGGELRVAENGRVPFDRWIAFASVALTGAIVLFLVIFQFRRRREALPKSALSEPSLANP